MRKHIQTDAVIHADGPGAVHTSQQVRVPTHSSPVLGSTGTSLSAEPLWPLIHGSSPPSARDRMSGLEMAWPIHEDRVEGK